MILIVVLVVFVCALEVLELNSIWGWAYDNLSLLKHLLQLHFAEKKSDKNLRQPQPPPKRCHCRAKSTQLCRSSESIRTFLQKSEHPDTFSESCRKIPSQPEATGSSSSFPGVTCKDSCIL